MRVIKFRAWHKEQNHLYRVIALFLGAKEQSVTLATDSFLPLTCLLSAVELMQFTGLQDANDKDIYEGDIVRADDEDVVGTVVWDTTFCRFFVDVRKPIPMIYALQGRDRWEILGNIYEHPQPLTEATS